MHAESVLLHPGGVDVLAATYPVNNMTQPERLVTLPAGLGAGITKARWVPNPLNVPTPPGGLVPTPNMIYLVRHQIL